MVTPLSLRLLFERVVSCQLLLVANYQLPVASRSLVGLEGPLSCGSAPWISLMPCTRSCSSVFLLLLLFPPPSITPFRCLLLTCLALHRLALPRPHIHLTSPHLILPLPCLALLTSPTSPRLSLRRPPIEPLLDVVGGSLHRPPSRIQVGEPKTKVQQGSNVQGLLRSAPLHPPPPPQSTTTPGQAKCTAAALV